VGAGGASRGKEGGSGRDQGGRSGYRTLETARKGSETVVC